jgi:hypothetical protein
MVTAVSYADIPAPTEVVLPATGVHYLMQDVIGSYSTDNRAEPQAFSTRVTTPQGIMRPHFHKAAGFHVFTHGEVHMGDTPIRPGAIHYTDAFTPYMGQIQGITDQFAFLECRVEHTTTSYYVPEGLEELQRLGKVPGRQFARNVELGKALRPAAGETAVEELAAAEADGLAARLVRLGPGATRVTVDAIRGSGRYYVVADGELTCDGKPLPQWSCVFLKAEDSPPSVEAGPAGADVLVLDFPAA